MAISILAVRKRLSKVYNRAMMYIMDLLPLRYVQITFR
jgi:hypothetical protein